MHPNLEEIAQPTVFLDNDNNLQEDRVLVSMSV